jgi:hypothetical protein
MQAQVGTELSNGSYKQQMQMLNDMDIANVLLFFLDRYVVVSVVFAMVAFALKRTKFPQSLQALLGLDISQEISLSSRNTTQQIFRLSSSRYSSLDFVLAENVPIHQIPQGRNHFVQGRLNVLRHDESDCLFDDSKQQ